MAIEFIEGTRIMNTGKMLVAQMRKHVARGLVSGPATPLILTGTLAFAGLSAAALNAAPDRDGQPAPSYPSNCHPDPDGDGNLVCVIDSSQLSAYSQGYCHSDTDSNGQLVCYINPSYLPSGTSSNK
jgi:hypothetical protein